MAGSSASSCVHPCNHQKGSIVSDALEEIGKDCPRCGSLLPDADEGVCQTCGYEYGRATLFMPVVAAPKPAAHAPDPDAPVSAAQPSPEVAASGAEAAHATVPVGQVRPEADHSKLLWGVLITLVFLFLAILAVIGWLLLR